MIEKIQERLLRFQLNDFHLSYEEPLKNNYANKSVKSSMIRDKSITCVSPTDMKEIFEKSGNRNSSRFPNNLKVPRFNQANYGTKSLHILDPKIWNPLPENLKSSSLFAEFKQKLKLWDGHLWLQFLTICT